MSADNHQVMDIIVNFILQRKANINTHVHIAYNHIFLYISTFLIVELHDLIVSTWMNS